MTGVADPNAPNIYAALEQQLGLKLTAAKGPAEVEVAGGGPRGEACGELIPAIPCFRTTAIAAPPKTGDMRLAAATAPTSAARSDGVCPPLRWRARHQGRVLSGSRFFFRH